MADNQETPRKPSKSKTLPLKLAGAKQQGFSGTLSHPRSYYTRKPSVKGMRQLTVEFPKLYLDQRYGKPEVKGEYRDYAGTDDPSMLDSLFKEMRKTKGRGTTAPGVYVLSRSHEFADSSHLRTLSVEGVGQNVPYNARRGVDIKELFAIREQERQPKKKAPAAGHRVSLTGRRHSDSDIGSPKREKSGSSGNSDFVEMEDVFFAGHREKSFDVELPTQLDEIESVDGESSEEDEAEFDMDRFVRTSRSVPTTATATASGTEVTEQADENYVFVNVEVPAQSPVQSARSEPLHGGKKTSKQTKTTNLPLRVVSSKDGKSSYFVDDSDPKAVKVYTLDQHKKTLNRVKTKEAMVHTDLRAVGCTEGALAADPEEGSREKELSMQPFEPKRKKSKRGHKTKEGTKHKDDKTSETQRHHDAKPKAHTTAASPGATKHTSKPSSVASAGLSLDELRELVMPGGKSSGSARGKKISTRVPSATAEMPTDHLSKKPEAPPEDDVDMAVLSQAMAKTSGSHTSGLSRIEQITLEKKLKQMEPPMYFAAPPSPQPLTMSFEYVGSNLTHKEVIKAIMTTLEYIPNARVAKIQFVPRTVLLGVGWVLNRWVVELSTAQCVTVLIGRGIILKGESVRMRKYDDVLREDYDKFLNNQEKFSKKTRNRHKNQQAGKETQAIALSLLQEVDQKVASSKPEADTLDTAVQPPVAVA